MRTQRRNRTGAVGRMALASVAIAGALLGSAAAANADPLTTMSLTDTASMTWTGGVANEQLGSTLASASDVNRDGLRDLLTVTASGLGYVLFTPPSVRGNSSVGSNGLSPARGYKIVIDGSDVGGMIDAGDQNGDGVPDQLVTDAIGGGIWVVYGIKSPSALPKCSPSGVTRCLTIDGTTAPTKGYKLERPSDPDFAVYTAPAVADFNGDGVQDLVLGGNLGNVTVVYGGRTASATPVDVESLPSSEAVRIDGPDPAIYFGGIKVTGIRDINGDGRDEISVVTASSPNYTAAMWLIYGRAGAASPMDLTTFGPSVGFRVDTVPLADPALQYLGDANGDGRPDLTLFGRSLALTTSFGGGVIYNPGPAGDTGLSMLGLTPSQGYLFKPVDASPMKVGDVLGDLNGDGVPDVVGGASGFSLADGSNGFAQVVFGQRPTPTTPFELGPKLTPDKGVALFDPASLNAGQGIVAAGDLDGDGLPDFFVSASSAPVGTLSKAGAVYFISGASLVPLVSGAKAQQVGPDRATLGGSVAGQKQGRIAVHVEYGPTTAYGSKTGDTPVFVADRVSDEVTGLTPSTTYHYRVVATNQLGLTRYGADATFTTAAKAPDVIVTPICVREPTLPQCQPVGPPPKPTPAALALTASPSAKSAKAGRAAAFKAKVANTGGTAAQGVKVCASVSSRVTVAKKCVTVGTLAAGASKTVSFSAKGTKKARGHTYKLSFKVTGTGVTGKGASAKLKVVR